MPLNATENYLKDRQDRVLINFAGTVVYASLYLTGPGGFAGDGYPMPAPGKVERLYVWDGVQLHSTTTQTNFNAGDRLSLYALYGAPYFQVTLRVNGVYGATYCTQVGSNTALQASLLVRLDVY
jgi:hypothetical protein